jgi:hypothetical protein
MMITFYGLLGLGIFLIGSSLLYYLGSRRKPDIAETVTQLLVRTGYNPKWVIIGLWALFALVAVAMTTFIAFYLYKSLIFLGSNH